jgi:hypothetical protein
MKNVFFRFTGLLLLAFTMLTPLNSKAQINLSGSWTALCSIEKDGDHLKFCDLCPFGYNADSSGIDILSFEMVFGEGMVSIISDKKTTKSDFQLLKDISVLEIYYEGNKEIFKVLALANGDYLLRDEEGMLISLEKKEQ